MKRASSSRQSMLPSRVPDNRTNMVNATPQSKDTAFGKLNILKPLSGTSERKTSFFGERASGVGLPRNSILGPFNTSEKIKDPRPLHDKSFIQQCIKQLSEFLSERGFPITMKTLQSPSTKEFLKIFEFLYTLLDPSFQMPTSKIEEEIPKLFKALGYPFALSKSSMYSVGAPHTWPQVLGALIWLIDTAKLFSITGDQDLYASCFSDSSSDTEGGAEFNKLFFEYAAKTYNNFMDGADTFEEEDREYLAKLKKLYNVDESLLQSLSEKHGILSEEVERLERESQTDRLMAKRTEKLKLQTDLQKLQKYRSNLEDFCSSLENKLSATTEELEAAELQVESSKQEKQRLQHILMNQKFSSADIERINRDRNELQQMVNTLTASLEEAEQHLWNQETALAKVKDEAEVELEKYHNLARKLKLIPASAENACGRDFEVKGTSGCGPSTLNQFKAHFKTMICDVEEEIARLGHKKLSLEETVEQVKSNMADKTNDMADLEEQIKKLDEQLELEMQEAAREEKKWASDVESVENHKKLLEKKVTDGYDGAVEELKAAQQQYHLVLQETNEQRRMLANKLHSVFSTAAGHLNIVENFLQDKRKKMCRLYEESICEEEAKLKELKDMVKSYVTKADAF